MKTRIAIDLRAWSWAGIGRYCHSLLNELLKRPDGYQYIGMVSRQDKSLVAAVVHEFVVQGKITFQEIEGSYYSWREQVLLPGQLAKVPADLWHFTHFNLPTFFSRPYVITIHDVTRLIFPGQTQTTLGRQLAYEWVFRRAVKRARLVLCVSQTTLKELRLLVPDLPPAMVTPEGVGEQYLRPVSQAIRQKAQLLTGSNAPFILYVGVWMGHKNLARILRAFARAKSEIATLKLVMTGRRRRGYEDLPRLAADAGVKDEEVVYLGLVPEDLLPGLYAQTAGLVMPSLYEGFGLPVLEAMAIKCPVIAANCSNFPDLTAGQAWLVNPEDEEQIAAAMVAIARGSYPRQLVRAANRQATKFSWRRCAEETVAAYAKALA